MIAQPTDPYFQRLYRRIGQPAGSSIPSAAPSVRPAARHTRRRYAAFAEATPAREDTPVADALEASAVSLGDIFSKLRDEQVRAQRPRGWARIAAHPFKSAVAAVLLLLLTGAAVILGPIAYRTQEAYRDVFVEPVNGGGPGLAGVINDEGTVEVVTVTPTPEDAALPEWNGSDRVTILLLGVDKSVEGASRSDTMILINVDPVEKSARMLSIPRDLRVIIPGYGAEKINAAFFLGDYYQEPGGGAGLMMRTIENNFGIDIDYFASVDFEGFTDIVDIVGGVTLDVPYPIRDDQFPGPNNQYMRIYFQPGWQRMDGERVLQYARTRHDDGDIRRAARQQQVLLALREQAVTTDLIRQAPELIAEVGDTVRTDLNSGQVLQLARLASEIDRADIVQMSLMDALTAHDEEEYYFSADWPMVGEIMTEFAGTEIIPPMAGLANPNYDTPIQILDGVINPGLGHRIRDVLVANGFTNVTVIELNDTAGDYPTSSITAAGADSATAFLLAQLLGISESAVATQQDVGPTPAPTDATSPTPTTVTDGTPASGSTPADETGVQPLFPTTEGSGSDASEPTGTIIIQLGDDVPDPAWSQDIYSDEPAP